MKLSQRYYRLLPMALTLAVATMCGCADTGARRSNYLPHRKSAAVSQPSLTSERPTRRTAQATAQSPQTRARSFSRQSGQTAPTTQNFSNSQRPIPTTSTDIDELVE